jgi:hypothetical protein
VVLETGTDPSIASNGVADYAIAFANSNGQLEVANSNGSVYPTSYVLAAGSSPSITWRGALSSTTTGYEIAFVDSAGVPRTLGFTGTGFAPGIAPSVSAATDADPSISSPGDGTYIVAFKKANGNLNTFNQAGSVSGWGLPLAPGTSPSVMTGYGSGSFKVAYEGTNNDLSEFSYTVTPATDCPIDKTCPPTVTTGSQDLGLGMLAGTSPSL